MSLLVTWVRLWQCVFTVETLFLRTLYVFFFIELGSRRVRFAGCTSHPTGTWVTQKARQILWQLEEQDQPLRFLIHDNDSKFTSSFDAVFASVQMKVIHSPIRAPNANAYAERWGRTVREECIGKLLILNEDHLRHVMRDYIDDYNSARPHQGIEQNTVRFQNYGQKQKVSFAVAAFLALFMTTIARLPSPASSRNPSFLGLRAYCGGRSAFRAILS